MALLRMFAFRPEAPEEVAMMLMMKTILDDDDDESDYCFAACNEDR